MNPRFWPIPTIGPFLLPPSPFFWRRGTRFEVLDETWISRSIPISGTHHHYTKSSWLFRSTFWASISPPAPRCWKPSSPPVRPSHSRSVSSTGANHRSRTPPRWPSTSTASYPESVATKSSWGLPAAWTAWPLRSPLPNLRSLLPSWLKYRDRQSRSSASQFHPPEHNIYLPHTHTISNYPIHFTGRGSCWYSISA